MIYSLNERTRQREHSGGATALFRNHSKRFVSYLLVGGSGIVVNMIVLFALVEGGHLNHMLAATISSVVSIFTNFVLNDHWTFRDRKAGTTWIGRATQYYAVAGFGLVFSMGALALLTLSLGVNYLLANLFAMGTAMVTNYALNARFTWRERRNPSDHGKILRFPVASELALLPIEASFDDIG